MENNEVIQEYVEKEKELKELEIQKNEVLSRNSSIFKKIKEIEEAQKQIQETQKLLKDKLTTAMSIVYVKKGIKTFENELLKITLVPSYEKVVVDTQKLQKDFEDVYLQCLKKSVVKDSVRITTK